MDDQRLPCSRHGFKCSTCIYAPNSPNNPMGHCFIIALYRQGSEGTVQLGNCSEVIQPSYYSLTTLKDTTWKLLASRQTSKRTSSLPHGLRLQWPCQQVLKNAPAVLTPDFPCHMLQVRGFFTEASEPSLLVTPTRPRIPRPQRQTCPNMTKRKLRLCVPSSAHWAVSPPRAGMETM